MHKKFLGPKMDSQRSHTFGHSLIATLYVHGEWTAEKGGAPGRVPRVALLIYRQTDRA